MIEKPKRKIISDAAAKLFVEKGFENTSTRDIARAAGISSSAIYYYFDSKEELLYQIVDTTLGAGLELITSITKSDKSLREKLTSILALHTRYYTVDTYKVILMVRDHKSLSPEHREALNDKRRKYVRALIHILDELKAKGEILDMDTTVCAFAFFGMVSWTYRWYDPNGRIKPDELSRIFNQIFTKGIFSDRRQI